MNREILFRGLHRRKGEKVWLNGEPVESKWVYGGVCQFEGERSIIYQTEPEIAKFPVYSETLGQYTGFTDENGVKIFEGDIIEVLGWRCVIKIGEYTDFDASAYSPTYGVYMERADKRGFTYSFASPVMLFSPVIIGNVHDNPELLEPDEKHE